ncbi:unnamed protein product [Heligmosomoides polygyrus]|uniref:Secreted protein n=1 Tax=Heligmosomoides polygyrus TaxID=6339 RepID=A0A183FUX7_HELPZ|nr:unnamed protein product [Heligmosomoides polygyrus]
MAGLNRGATLICAVRTHLALCSSAPPLRPIHPLRTSSAVSFTPEPPIREHCLFRPVKGSPTESTMDTVAGQFRQTSIEPPDMPE